MAHIALAELEKENLYYHFCKKGNSIKGYNIIGGKLVQIWNIDFSSDVGLFIISYLNKETVIDLQSSYNKDSNLKQAI